jgi:hypothetical protein
VDASTRAHPRWVGTGAAALDEAEEAGAVAARSALVADDPKLLVVFAAEDGDLDGVLRGIRGVAGDVPLIGCSTAGEIGSSGPADSSVVVMALGGEGFSVATGVGVADAGRDLRAAAETAATCAHEVEDRPHQVLLLLSDGLAGDQQEVVRGAYGVVGASMPLVGGCAGDGLRMRHTSQLHGDRVLRNAVVAAAIASDAPMGIGVRHGWRRVGEAMVVTSSESNRVLTIDDQPALDVYLRRLGAPREVAENADAFTQFAMTHPLGISRRNGEEVRFVAEADFEDRSIVCIAQVPSGGLTWIMEGDDLSVLEATDGACADALHALGGRPPLGVLAFDCIARRGVLGEPGIRTEIDRINEHVGGAPVVGFYTYGEIARTRGVTGFHNQTLVLLAVS